MTQMGCRKRAVLLDRWKWLVLLAFSPAVAVHPATAQLPTYLSPAIYARSGFTAFNLPPGSSFTSATASLNESRQVALDVNFVGSTGNPGVFLGNYNQGSPTGGIVVNAADTILGDPQINQDGQIVFVVGLANNVFLYDSGLGTTTQINYPLGVTSSDALTITNDGLLGGRLSFGFAGRAYGVFNAQSSGFPALDLFAVDSGLDASSPYSFFFSPALSDTGGPQGTPRIAAKVATTAGTNFQQIRLFDSDGTSLLVAANTTSDPNSSISALVTNSVSISSNGQHVAFQGNDLQGTSGIYRFDAATNSFGRMAFVGDGLVTAIDFFAPDVNDSGLVTFRGRDQTGRSSVFIADGNDSLRLLGEGDLIETDLGLRQLGRRDGQSSQSGAPRINNRGDISTSFQYFDPSNPNSVADGTLLMLMATGLLGDFNQDGVLDCADVDALVTAIADGSQDPQFDLNGDGLVDLNDLDQWLAVAGSLNLPSGSPYLPGDANLDGVVDAQDFVIWNQNKFSAASGWCAGDFNADGVVDASDFIVWNQFKFQSADHIMAVPEPTVPPCGIYWCCLLAIAALWIRSP